VVTVGTMAWADQIPGFMAAVALSLGTPVLLHIEVMREHLPRPVRARSGSQREGAAAIRGHADSGATWNQAGSGSNRDDLIRKRSFVQPWLASLAMRSS
jgi:hypothetical protein